jgi:hypothetical protein
VAGPVQAPIERALEQPAHRRRAQEGQRQRRQERHAGAVHQHHGHIAAEHGKGAMGQVDEVHQPHGHGQANADQEQQAAVRQAVEQHAKETRDHRGRPPFSGLPPDCSVCAAFLQSGPTRPCPMLACCLVYIAPATR